MLLTSSAKCQGAGGSVPGDGVSSRPTHPRAGLRRWGFEVGCDFGWKGSILGNRSRRAGLLLMVTGGGSVRGADGAFSTSGVLCIATCDAGPVVMRFMGGVVLHPPSAEVDPRLRGGDIREAHSCLTFEDSWPRAFMAGLRFHLSGHEPPNAPAELERPMVRVPWRLEGR
jgi:hypothetical protein